MPFVTTVFALDELVAAYLPPLRSAPRELDEVRSDCTVAVFSGHGACPPLQNLLSSNPAGSPLLALLVNPCGYYLRLRELMFGRHYVSTPDMYQRI